MVDEDLRWVLIAVIFSFTILVIMLYWISSKYTKSGEGGVVRDPILRSLILFFVAVIIIKVMQYLEVLAPDFDEEYWWVYLVLFILIVGVNLAIFVWSRKKSFEELKAAVQKWVEKELQVEFVSPGKFGEWIVFYKEIEEGKTVIGNFTIKTDKQKEHLVQIDVYTKRIVGFSDEFAIRDKNELKKRLIPDAKDDLARRSQALLEADPNEDTNDQEE